MIFKSEIRQFLEKVTGFKFIRRLPHGCDFFDDVSHHFPNYKMEIIADVGANTGQSALEFASRNPHARILSFEPIRSTFEVLTRNTEANNSITCYNVALGEREGTGAVERGEDSSMNQVREHSGSTPDGVSAFSFEITTLDRFCNSSAIKHINFLKIDTEGADLKVIRGGRHLLSEQMVDFVEVEAGMHPGNTYQVSMEDLKQEMESNGYVLFGIYEQVHEWPTENPNLRRSNLVFVCSKLLK